MAVTVEVCVESSAGAVAAEQAGADRVELCSALILGGLTPSWGTIVTTLRDVSRIGVQVLIRPRGGDFVFTPAEVDAMVADIQAISGYASTAAAPVGFVIGALTAGSEIDQAVTKTLVAACNGTPVTFHRAFDLTNDLEKSLEALASLGVSRVLTSGGASRAADGSDTLARLIKAGSDTIVVMPGGGVRANNVTDLLAETEAREVHFRAAAKHRNYLSPRQPELRMASAKAPTEEIREETSPALVREMLAVLGR